MTERVPIATRKDFRIDWYSGTGAGGQHRNKHQNCCRITHIPTGMVETGQTNRDRPSNQKEAFRKLAARVVDHYLGEERKLRYSAPTEIVRTYHQPDNRVKDHASGFQQSFDAVMDDLGPQIEARRTALIEQLIQEQVE